MGRCGEGRDDSCPRSFHLYLTNFLCIPSQASMAWHNDEHSAQELDEKRGIPPMEQGERRKSNIPSTVLCREEVIQNGRFTLGYTEYVLFTIPGFCFSCDSPERLMTLCLIPIFTFYFVVWCMLYPTIPLPSGSRVLLWMRPSWSDLGDLGVVLLR